MFPIINTMADLTPHLVGAEHIKGYVRDGYIVYDYAYQVPAAQWTPYWRECRGIKFYPNGRIAARPFHKFFNLGERPTDEPSLGQPHSMQLKLDGSMIHPLWINGQMELCTRMGITDVAQRAWPLVTTDIRMLCYHCEFFYSDGAPAYTPIFEYTGPENRIVLQYAEPKLTLLAVRHKVTGEYLYPLEVKRLAAEFKVSCVTHRRMDLTTVKAHKEIEGVVCVFPSGERLKVKADDYVLRHKTKDNLTHEKNVLAIVLKDTTDDLVPLLSPEDGAKLKLYQMMIFSRLTNIENEVGAICNYPGDPRDKGNQKDFALFVKKHFATEPAKQSLAFGFRKAGDAGDWLDILCRYIEKHLTTGTKCDLVCKALALPRWNYSTPKE